MSKKNLLKFVIAFGVLAVLLIFLGVNYVPRVSALSSAKQNSVNPAYYVGSDWIERHPPAAIDPKYFAGSDWIERHPSNYLVGSDWVERHPSNYYTGSDWIERHPIQPDN